jgi:hypothetical protein
LHVFRILWLRVGQLGLSPHIIPIQLCNTHATHHPAILPSILEEMACFLASQGAVTPGLEKNAVRHGVLTAYFSRLTGSPAICPLAQP